MNVAEILDGYLRALESGEAPGREALLARHPDLADELAAALDGLDFVHRAGRGLAGAYKDEEAAPGKALGDYRLLREVGRGGMAVVYEAEQVSLGRRVALKVLPFAAVLDPKQLQRFKNEALAAAHLRHPNIVPVYAVGCERGVHYYAMQYVEGQSLALAIRDMKGVGGLGSSDDTRPGSAGEGPKTPISSHGSNREPAYVRMAAALGMQAAEALDHAHELGIVHRDVKPGNLLVDGTGTMWVTDFGLARSLNDVGLTITGELLGTVRYMSPEQALAKRVPMDHRTDIYSLGATLYELFTLEPAFPGDDPHLVIQDIAFKEPVPPRKLNPALPVDLETVLLKAMTKDPAGRYATAREMADDIRRYLEDKPVLARRPSVAARLARWSRRHRGLVAASFVVLAIAVLLLAGSTLLIAKEQLKTSDALRTAQGNLSLARAAVDEFLLQEDMERLEILGRRLSPGRKKLVEAALEFYKTYAQAEPDQIGGLLGSLGRPEEALAAFDRAIAIDPNDSAAHVHRGIVLHEIGRPREALEACERAVSADPRNAYAYYHLAHALSGMGEHGKAVATYDQAIANDPGIGSYWLSTAYSNRGVEFAAQGLFSKAMEDYDRAVQIDPTNGEAHANRASILCDVLCRYPEALDALDRAAERIPDRAEIHYNRGNTLGQMGHPDLAVRAFDRAIALDANQSAYHTSRAFALLSMGNLPDALKACDRAIALDAGDTRARCNRAGVLEALGRDRDALAEFDAALAVDPKDYTIQVDRADVHEALGNHTAALADCDAAIKLHRDCAVAHFLRGQALAALNRPEEALDALEQALRIEGPGALSGEAVAQAHERTGELRISLGHLKEGLKELERAIDLGSRSPSILNHVAWIRATSADPAVRDGSRAVAAASQSVVLSPEDGNSWNTLGVALCADDAWQEALGAFARSMKLRSGGDAYDWFFVAIAQARLGQAEARRWHDKAVAWMEANKPGDEELRRFRAEAAAALE